MTAAGDWVGWLLVCAVVGAFAAGCTATPPPETAIDRALEDNLGPGAIVDGVRTWEGLAASPETALDHPNGYILLEGPPDLAVFWADHAADGSDAPDIDWSTDTVLAVALPPGIVTRIRFYRALESLAHETVEVYLRGDTEPAEGPDYPAPWCVIAIPRQGMAVIAHVLCTRPRPTGGYQVWAVRNEARFDLRPEAAAFESETAEGAPGPEAEAEADG